ncbi:MAG: hypothetical protein ABIL70_04255 [candidate division WOR-3 bacterium]
MAKFWKDFSKWLEDASRVLSKEAGDLTLKGKLKLEVFELKRRLQEQYKELGVAVYEQISKKSGSVVVTPSIKGILSKIKRIQKEIKEKEKYYKKIGEDSCKKTYGNAKKE